MARRREFLGAAVVVAGSSLGGCFGTLGQDDPAGIDAEIVDVVDGGPSITFDVEQASTRLNGDELPRFSVTISNVGEAALTFTHGPSGMVFNPGPSDPSGLYVLQAAEGDAVEAGTSEVLVDAGEDCLAVEHPPARAADEAHRTLEPDEVHGDDFALVVDGDEIDNTCLGTGEYEFRQRYEFYHPDVPDSEEPEHAIDWGFSVSVTEGGNPSDEFASSTARSLPIIDRI